MTQMLGTWLMSTVIVGLLLSQQGCRSTRELFPKAVETARLTPDPLVDAREDRVAIDVVDHQAQSSVTADIQGNAEEPSSTLLLPEHVSQDPQVESVPTALPDSLVNALDDALVSSSLTDAQSDGGLEHVSLIPSQGGAEVVESSAVIKRISRVAVSGVRPGKGELRVAIFTSAAGFPQSNGASQVFTAKSDQTTIELPLQVEPPFAVAVYQDINGDGELTKNRLGIPVEPFAFSNNAMGPQGPPSFDQARVEAPESAALILTIPIRLP